MAMAPRLITPGRLVRHFKSHAMRRRFEKGLCTIEDATNVVRIKREFWPNPKDYNKIEREKNGRWVN